MHGDAGRNPMKPILRGRRTQLIVLIMAGMRLGGISFEAAADEKSSLTDLDMKYTEAKVAMEGAERENTALRRQLELARQQVAALTDSLVLANSESEVFKRETSDLKLRLEALGLDSASPDKALLEQRLLKAVSDLKIVQDQKDKLSEQLIRINEAILRYIKNASSVDGDARMALEAEMRSSTELLGLTGPRRPGPRPVPPAPLPTPASSASRMNWPWLSPILAAARGRRSACLSRFGARDAGSASCASWTCGKAYPER